MSAMDTDADDDDADDDDDDGDDDGVEKAGPCKRCRDCNKVVQPTRQSRVADF